MIATVETAVLLLPMMALSPWLPKRTLLLPILYLLWAWFGAIPLGTALEGPARSAAVALVQVLVAAAAYLTLRLRNGAAASRPWLITPDTTGRRSFSFAYTAGFSIFTLLTAPVVLIVMTVLYAGTMMLDSAGGFLTLSSDGIYTEERRYTRDEKTVYLVGMVHVGDRGFY
jgi:hypothetical protein